MAMTNEEVCAHACAGGSVCVCTSRVYFLAQELFVSVWMGQAGQVEVGGCV